MKLLTLTIAFALSLCAYSQNLIKIHNVANLAAANMIPNPEKGQVVYLDSEQNIYYYDGLNWVAIEGMATGSVCAFTTQNGITSNATGNLATDDFVFGRTTLDYTSTSNLPEFIFFFDKSKGAFRAGGTQTNNWNDGNRGVGSVAFGTDNRASGMGSVSFGNLNMSTGEASFSAGENSVASNTASIAIGSSVTAEAPGQVTIGHGNTAGTSTATSTNPFPATDRLFVIGNNSATSGPRNSLTMLNNGNTTVSGTWTGPSFVTTSDRRLKKDIKDLELGMDFLKKIETKSYTLKNSTNKDRIHYGVIAQDLQKINPNLVYGEESETENLSVNYTEMIPILINAIIELDEEIELLKQRK